MFTASDYEKLQQIMEESTEKKELLTRLLTSHQVTISSISHEIRNPLTLVYSTLQIIETQYPEVLTYEHWSDLHSDIEYMKLLLEELSAYNNGNRLNLSIIDSNTFFRTLALSFASSLIDTEIQFISKIDPQLPFIQGDAVKLREVFLNLLGNARDALNSDSTIHTNMPSIHLSVTHDKDSLIITIKDNGCGISEEKLPHIFEPFVTYKKNGTGLGLAITSRIVKSHKGTIHVSSISNVHTTFLLTLPIEKNT